MRTHLLALASLVSSIASAQTVTSVYNRDTHEPFQLKRVKVESTVIGPIVRTSTWLTYENPYRTMTEATLNFQLPEAAALSGFAYLFGKEYVPGHLMDKTKAWAIYTAITSRGRDPGIMEQWSPTEYHCQIFPIKQGDDLRVRLWTVGMLQPGAGTMDLPKPQVPKAVGYEVKDGTVAEPEWSVRSVKSGAITKASGVYSVDLPGAVHAVAQRFKDGRVYVAGLLKADEERHPPIEIVKASYEPFDGSKGGADVTERVAQIANAGSRSVFAGNANFGDPTPGVVKRLKVTFRSGDQEFTREAPENQTLVLTQEGAPPPPTVKGLKQIQTIQMNPNTYAFAGWLHKNRTLEASFCGKRTTFRPASISAGADAARLWAQQMLARSNWNAKQNLAFSMKYGVPSNSTALLAVPKAEMRAYQEREAERRKKELQAKRQQRNWSGKRDQNWNSSGGGDPEIRVVLPGAQSVEAILPDRRVLSLKADGDVWGGNFEIPAQAPEGAYTVRIVARMKDGSKSEKSWTYDVDRTPPKGDASFVKEGSKLFLQVLSESGLSEVAAYDSSGKQLVLKEDRPGIYRVEVQSIERMTVVLKDRAGNKGDLICSSPL